MARSIDPAPKAVRGFVPARNDEERYLMRHIEDLARTASSRGIARYSGFLSDREQQLAQAALNRTDMPEDEIRFDGGWPGAERKLLCLEPVDSYPASPLCCVRLQCRALPGAQLPAHKDYLGSLMGLELRREALGDIVLPEDQPGVAYVFALEPAAELICQELRQAGHTDLTAEMQPLETPDGDSLIPAAGRGARCHAAVQPWNGGRTGHGRTGGDQPSACRECPCPGVRGRCVHSARQGPLSADGIARKKQERPFDH